MITKIRNKVLKVGILFLAVVALVLGMALPAMAQTPQPSNVPNIPLHGLQGKVLSVQNTSAMGSFVIQNGNQTPVTLNVDQNTKYYIINMGRAQSYVNNQVAKDNRIDKKAPSPQQRAQDLRQSHIPANWRSNLGWLDTFDNQASFSNITAGDRVIVRADANNLAKQVLIIKAPVNRTVKGNIALTDPTHITITPSGGSPVVLNVVGTTRIVLKGLTSTSGYGVATYNSTNNNALAVSVQPTPSAS